MIKHLHFDTAKILALLIAIVIIAQSCKKDIIQPKVKSDISIADARSWYDSQLPKLAKTSGVNKTTSSIDNKRNFSLLWNLATENIAKSNKGVVAIPLKNDIKLKFGKYGFRK